MGTHCPPSPISLSLSLPPPPPPPLSHCHHSVTAGQGVHEDLLAARPGRGPIAPPPPPPISLPPPPSPTFTILSLQGKGSMKTYWLLGQDGNPLPPPPPPLPLSLSLSLLLSHLHHSVTTGQGVHEDLLAARPGRGPSARPAADGDGPGTCQPLCTAVQPGRPHSQAALLACVFRRHQHRLRGFSALS